MTDAPDPRGHLPPEDRSPAGPRPALLWGALLLAVVLGAVQGIGLLVGPPPGPALPVAPVPPTQADAGARPRAEVLEVAVGAPAAAVPAPAEVPRPPATSRPGEPAAAPELPAKPPAVAPGPAPSPEPPTTSSEPPADTPPGTAPSAAPAVVTRSTPEPALAAEPPAPAAASEATAEAPPAAPSGDYVLQLGAFRSQRYRREAEETAARLGLPHFREERSRSGTSFRLQVRPEGPEAASRAAALLDGAGYLHRETPGGLEARFALEEEARAASDLLGRAGLGATYSEEEGSLFWMVYAGPFPEEEAEAVRERLGREGVESFLRRRR